MNFSVLNQEIANFLGFFVLILSEVLCTHQLLEVLCTYLSKVFHSLRTPPGDLSNECNLQLEILESPSLGSTKHLAESGDSPPIPPQSCQFLTIYKSATLHTAGTPAPPGNEPAADCSSAPPRQTPTDSRLCSRFASPHI